MADQDAPSHVDQALQNTRSGIPFQYAVLRYCDELFKRTGTAWRFEVAEFPVSANGADTRIDFVLQGHSSWRSSQDAYLVCECKRPNPAIADWAFLRSPYSMRGRDPTPTTIFDAIMVEPTTGRLRSEPKRGHGQTTPYNVAIELKGTEKGDSAGSGRGAIEDAATQVCRGVGGLVNFFTNHATLLEGRAALVVPVVFTTARLYVSDVDLGGTSLTTGKLPDGVTTTEAPWVWYQYNLSSTLKHNAPATTPDLGLTSLGEVLQYEFSRSIAIVGSNGIEKFIQEMTFKMDATMPLIP